MFPSAFSDQRLDRAFRQTNNVAFRISHESDPEVPSGDVHRRSDCFATERFGFVEVTLDVVHLYIYRHVARAAVFAAAWLAERVPAGRYTWERPPLTRVGVAFAGSDMRFSIAKARTRLGYAPRVPLREGIRLAAAWYQGENPAPVTPVVHDPAVVLRTSER